MNDEIKLEVVAKGVVPHLDDPLVRRMADSNHRPAERWTYGGDVLLICDACSQDWPCATRTLLRQMETQ